MRPPGSVVKLTVLAFDGELPEPGDFLRTAAGSCYQVQEFKPSRPGSKSLGRFVCMKLERDAVDRGDPGVFDWAFYSR